jgi:hypothetical protein
LGSDHVLFPDLGRVNSLAPEFCPGGSGAVGIDDPPDRFPSAIQRLIFKDRQQKILPYRKPSTLQQAKKDTKPQFFGDAGFPYFVSWFSIFIPSGRSLSP